MNILLSHLSFDSTPQKLDGQAGFAYFLGPESKKAYENLLEEHALDWQIDSFRQSEKDLLSFSGEKGPVWIMRSKEPKSRGHWGVLSDSPYAGARDLAGSLLAQFRSHSLKTVSIEFIGTDAEQELATLVGFEIAAYNFREIHETKKTNFPKIYINKAEEKFNKSLVKAAEARAAAVNLARHLTNLPPNDLNPSSFVKLIKELKWNKNFTIEVWNSTRLKKERCGLHLAVGQGSETPPCLVHIRYRPLKKKGRPIAFVGKGITFDTGGLDLKPSAGMRLMKKDMGGAAAVLGLAYFLSKNQISRPCDFYLALAENSMDGRSFRPSDIVVARSGARVEIDNTDAEGRLVLADALDVAVTQKGAHEPELVIDVATLTGAIKVALGADMAGLFCNDDDLADQLLAAGQKSGDPVWRMPLIEKYFSGLVSSFADFKNSSDGFGGAITAALFLQRFVRGKKWAHLDIYAWVDKASGALTTSGGTGQAVQCLIDFLLAREE